MRCKTNVFRRDYVDASVRNDPVTTEALCRGGDQSAMPKSRVATKRRPLAQLVGQGGDIVCAAGNGGLRAMSARRILGLKPVPRVGLFAH